MMTVDPCQIPRGSEGRGIVDLTHQIPAALTRDEGGAIAHIHDAGQHGGGLWLVDLERATRTKITFEPHHEAEAVLLPDGEWIAFSSNRGGTDSLYRRRSNGSGASELLWRIDGRIFPSDWSKNWIVANVFQPGPSDGELRPGWCSTATSATKRSFGRRNSRSAQAHGASVNRTREHARSSAPGHR